MNFLVTGSAGFIGFHVSKLLLAQGNIVIGIDNLNEYYDVNLKNTRLNILKEYLNFSFIKVNLANTNLINKIFKKYNFQRVIHLGAQAGVRYSIDNPYAYIDSNLLGFFNILEGCKNHKIEHLVYASSSSVYGFHDTKIHNLSIDNVSNYPLSLYAATKRSNELIAHTYSYIYNLPTTGLRFFSVYGPFGRPDMAIFKFTKLIIEGKCIDVYNNGNMKRDFTYIDDVVNIVSLLQNFIPKKNYDLSKAKQLLFNNTKTETVAPYSIYNVGCGKAVNLIKCINILEKELKITAKKNMLPMQPGDMLETRSNNDTLHEIIGDKSFINIEKGIQKFIAWYKNFYNI